MAERVFHTIEPLFTPDSRVLILGTMPSPRSRAEGFYYAHPQNRFWPALAAVYGEPVPQGTRARAEFARRHVIALWDVLASCTIQGAADSTSDVSSPSNGKSVWRLFSTRFSNCIPNIASSPLSCSSDENSNRSFSTILRLGSM